MILSPMRRNLWSVAAFLLALCAGAAFFQILWKVYAGPVSDYGAPPFSVGPLESTFFFWFNGLGLLASIGITIGLALMLPKGFGVPAKWSVAMIPAAVALALLARFMVFQQTGVTDEENVHRFTAQLLARGHLTLHNDVPADLIGKRWGWFQHGQEWSGIYPNGWPLFLAVGYLLKAPWLLNPLLAGLALWLAASVAKSIYGERAGSLTLLFLGLAPFFVLTAATDAASPLAAVGVLAGIFGMLRSSEDNRDLSSISYGLLCCGVGSGVALLTRPIVAFALLGPWWLALLLRERNPRRLLAWTSPIAAAIFLLMFFNSQQTGSALETTYTAALRDFGVKLGSGMLGLDTDYRPVGGIGTHTIGLGILAGFVNLLRLNSWMLGWPLSLLLVCCAPWSHGTKPKATKLILSGVAILMLLKIGSFSPGYTITGPPDYFEAGCLLVILIAGALQRLHQFAPGGTAALAVSILAVNLVLFVPVQVRSLRGMARGAGLLSQTVREKASLPAVVFVDGTQSPSAQDSGLRNFVFFAPLNASMDDPVVFLMGRKPEPNKLEPNKPENEAWRQYFPGRHAYRYRVADDWKPVLEPLP